MKIIYDVGSNNGDDIPYYFHKADRVVAIEANPILTEGIRQRFSSEIATGKLVVENCAVAVDETQGAVPFYVHKYRHVESQFPRPANDLLDQFDAISVQAQSLVSIVRKHGSPHYIKIDVERYDAILLKDLFQQGVFPPYISAESHEIATFATLVALGAYQAFKLVDGGTVPQVYGHHRISTTEGVMDYSFPGHSAGPYGNDIEGPWLSADSFLKVLAEVGMGWKDIHASNVDLPER